MRKIVQVVGVGQRKSGLSRRTGKKYDFTEVSISYEDDEFVGLKCETVPFDAPIIGDRVLAPGDTLDCIMHQSNFKTYVDAIL